MEGKSGERQHSILEQTREMFKILSSWTELAISVLSVQMKLQQAKESFMERLARERREKESGGLSLVSYSFYH